LSLFFAVIFDDCTGSLNFFRINQIDLLLVTTVQHLVLLPPHPGKKCRGGEGAVAPLASPDTGYARELPVGHNRVETQWDTAVLNLL